MFKKIFVVSVLLLLAASHTVFSQAVTIDTAIENAAREMSTKIPAGTRIAVLNITADSASLSDYIINQLIVNLVNTGSFQVVPRSTIELQLAQGEFDFQHMSNYFSIDNQKRLGQFLEAGTIITGTVTRDSANSYLLSINAIHLESFTYQSSYSRPIRDDQKVKTLVAGSGSMLYEDYTFGQRLGMGALNMFFGIGSTINGQHLGWVVTVGEIVGGALLASGLGMNPKPIDFDPYWEPTDPRNKYGGFSSDFNRKEYEQALATKDGLIISGAIVAGSAIVFGYIIPFFHHRPNANVSQNNFPFDFELVSSNNRVINGFRLTYNMRF